MAAILAVAMVGGVGLLGVRLRPYWVAKYRGEEADLSGAFLRFAPLAGAQLWEADLSEADLHFANLRGAALGAADAGAAVWPRSPADRLRESQRPWRGRWGSRRSLERGRAWP